MLNRRAKITDARLPPDVYADLRRTLQALDGQVAHVRIEKAKKQRSLSQNAFYFGVVIPAVHAGFIEFGNDVTPEEVHEYLKEHVGKLVKTVMTPDGRRSLVVRSSAELNTVDWERFMDQIRAWAAPFGLQIPFPNEYHENHQPQGSTP